MGVIEVLPSAVRAGAMIAGGHAMVWVADVLRRDPLAAFVRRPGIANPYPLYERVRTLGPLTKSSLGVSAVTSHKNVSEVLRSRTFGVRKSDGQSTNLAEIDFSLLDMDPPDHTRLRRLVMPGFSPKRLVRFEELITTSLTELIADIPRGETFDLVEALSSPLPVKVITELLGIPEEDRANFVNHGAAIASVLDGFDSLEHRRRVITTTADLREIFTRLLTARRADPQDDIVSDLAASDAAVDDLINLCQLLLIAGFETTVNLISTATLTLQRHPDQWAMLREDPALAGAVVEETLRYDPPVQYTGRIAHADTQIAGQNVPAGTVIIPMMAAAGRDPEAYDRPNVFDITRPKQAEHLAFSAGVHYCVGAPLARLEAVAALTAIATELPRLRLAGPVTYRKTNVLRGPSHLPMKA